MKIDIWSDIRCPFCYIGKRKFETALQRFEQREQVEVEWHSFELDPSLETDTTVSIYDYLAKHKGMSHSRSVQMNQQVMEAAKEAGLLFNFDNLVLANSFNAHRLIQLAKTKNLGDVAEEALFKAQFIEAKNIDDDDTLIAIGNEIGLSASEIASLLASDAYSNEVRKDEAVANHLGINGVPFFVLNNKYGVSGAQAPETFLQALQQAWAEYEKEHPHLIMNTATGDTCDADGTCIPTNNN